MSEALNEVAYNSNGWNTSVVNGRGHTRTYQHNNRGEVTRLTMPDGAIEQWTYNGTGDTTGYTSPLGFTNSYVYDNAGRMTTVDYPSGVDTTFGYDNSSRQTSMVDSTGTTTWSYNAADELTSLAQPQGTTTYTYNLAGQKASMTEVGLGTTNYTYFANGRLWHFIDRHGDQTVFLYDSLGRNHIRINPNGTSDQMQFDNRDRLTAIDLYNSGGSFLRRQSYTYDAASQMLTHTTDGVTTTYTYDPVGQLLSETRPGYTGTYTYDGNGNRLTRSINGVVENYSYDSGDKLQSVSVGGTPIKTYGYDAAGRTTSVTSSAGITTLTYDFESRIAQITGPGITATYSYNGLDTRVGKTENSVSNTFRRSGAYVTDPVLGDGSASYTPGVSRRTGTETRYFHNGLKNTDSLTNPSQTVAAARIYDAFGNVISSSGTWSGSFGYAGNFGYQQDASGLKLLGHRYYDPSTGRFLTRDPIKDGRNWYAYGAGEAAPSNFADPDGLEPVPGKTPPPVPVPGGGADNGWKWVPNPKFDPENPKSRPGKWVPKTGVKGTKGGQPSASWDRVHDHWDVDDGQGNRNRYDENGKFLRHEEAHKPRGNRASPSKPKQSQASPASNALGLFTRLGGLLGLLFTPTNMDAPSCLGMRHDHVPMCTGCGHICTEPSKKSDPPRRGRKG